jgi:hypothetical protein
MSGRHGFSPLAPRVSVATEHIEWQHILTDILQIGAAGAIGLICNRRVGVCVRKPDFALFSGRLCRYSEVLQTVWKVASIGFHCGLRRPRI